MEKAKAAISDFMHKSGKHDTTVHETVAPAVQSETVKPTRHENVTTAVDKEVHQDHYHTSVQPVHDREVLPEKHTHNLVPVEHRHHEHDNESNVKAKLEREAAQFKDSSVTASTQHTQSVNPSIGGEHIHHHVHENIQPVVHKETIQPNVVHTTVPIHEVHHNAAQHHTSSALPAMSMSDFKSQGGVLSGREERYDGFEGQPKDIGKSLGGHFGSHSHGEGGSVQSTGSARADGPLSGTTGSHGGIGSHGTTGTHHTSGLTSGSTGLASEPRGLHSGSTGLGNTSTSTSTTTSTGTSGLNSNVPAHGLQ